MCKCAVGGVSPERGSRGQPRGSRLRSGTHAAAKA